MDFYDDTKWCPKCRQYVQYMRSLHTSFCVRCDGKVVVFNRQDMQRFHDTPVLYD
jgi:hypothetical protein